MGASELVVDVAKIKRAAHNAIALNILTYTLPHDIEVYMEEVLDVFLAELGQRNLKDYIVYCLRELAVNAKKANTKRVYFDSRGLDIDDPDQYEEGMTSFKQDTMDNIAWYLQKQKEKGYYIKIIFQAKGPNIIFEVRNNVEINKKEYVRIHDKLARSRKYTSLEEALQQVLDPSEGAGLGLVILILMLNKIGLDEDCFDIWAESGETVARITVPVASARIESVSTLTDEIVKSITSLPQFPENIVQIQRLIADPDSQIVDIARYISTDPAMTADLLKLVNSAAYMMTKKVDNIVDAVKLVGLRGIKNLLYSYGTLKILDDGASDKKKLWDHSYRTAYYAYNLAKNFKANIKGLLDDAYVGGMLHDMGKIIFSSVHPDLLEKIRGFCKDKDIPADTFEGIAGRHEPRRDRRPHIGEVEFSRVARRRNQVSPRAQSRARRVSRRGPCRLPGQYLLRVRGGQRHLRADRALGPPGLRLHEREAFQNRRREDVRRLPARVGARRPRFRAEEMSASP